MSWSPQSLGETLSCSLRNFHRDKCLDLSAAVAFYSLLSLGPLLYLLGLTLSRVFDLEGPIETAVSRLSGFLPRGIVPSVRSISESLQGGEGLVLVALPGLVWVATSALYALESAVNVAFGTTHQRRFLHSRLKALAVLGSGWLLLTLSLFGGALQPRLGRLGHWFDVQELPFPLSRVGSYLVLMLVSYVAFLFFYKVLPRGRVSWRASGLGAALALALWEIARRLFALLLARSPALGVLTGTLAGVVAFLLWIYTAVAIMLLGAEVAAVLNGSRTAQTENP